MPQWVLYPPIIGVLGLIFAWIIYAYVKKQPVGTQVMEEISEAIHDGAMVFLKKEYSYLVLFIVVVFLLAFSPERFVPCWPDTLVCLLPPGQMSAPHKQQTQKGKEKP
jgi:Na+/H+-translocating membrane pyrophosphatase